MKVFDLYNTDGQLQAFEIGNSFLSRLRMARILSSFWGVTMTRRPKLFSRLREEEFCEFRLNNKAFRVWEPFGDNSRYHVGQKSAEPCEEIQILRNAFAFYGGKDTGANAKNGARNNHTKLIRVLPRNYRKVVLYAIGAASHPVVMMDNKMVVDFTENGSLTHKYLLACVHFIIFDDGNPILGFHDDPSEMWISSEYTNLASHCAEQHWLKIQHF